MTFKKSLKVFGALLKIIKQAWDKKLCNFMLDFFENNLKVKRLLGFHGIPVKSIGSLVCFQFLTDHVKTISKI